MAARLFRTSRGLPEKWDKGAEYIALFPNLLYGVQRDHSYVLLLQPLGLARTLERVAISYADEVSLSEDFDELRRANEETWKEIFEEDRIVVEGMQRGRHAPGFDGGKFSPVMDNPTHVFHTWVADRMTG